MFSSMLSSFKACTFSASYHKDFFEISSLSARIMLVVFLSLIFSPHLSSSLFVWTGPSLPAEIPLDGGKRICLCKLPDPNKSHCRPGGLVGARRPLTKMGPHHSESRGEVERMEGIRATWNLVSAVKGWNTPLYCYSCVQSGEAWAEKREIHRSKKLAYSSYSDHLNINPLSI